MTRKGAFKQRNARSVRLFRNSYEIVSGSRDNSDFVLTEMCNRGKFKNVTCDIPNFEISQIKHLSSTQSNSHVDLIS